MKIKRALSAAVLLFLALLTACSNTKTPEAEQPSASDTPTASAPDTPAATGSEQPAVSDTPSVSGTGQLSPEYRKITPKEAQSMMSDDVLILDVRTQEEFDDGHILYAVLLPYDEIGEKAESVIPDKNRTILVYCRSGRRSETAARELVNMGYSEVYDFGGVIDWPGQLVVDR